MTANITISAGFPGDEDRIIIDWSDENNIRYREILEIVTLDQDKPRTLEIRLNGEVIASMPGAKWDYRAAMARAKE